MKVVIDLEKVGYITGRLCGKAVKCVSIIQMTRTSVRGIVKVATKHKIDSNDAAAVTTNVFNCLRFID